jgi:hypothetical protein
VKIAGALLTALVIVSLACDSLFSTREPEPPENPQSSWVPPLSPDQVLSNLQNAVSERNVENYVRCLINPGLSSRIFVFEPDPEVAANYPDLFQEWNRETERNVMQQLVALVPADSAFYLTYTETVQEIVAPDSAVMIRRYRLGVHHREAGIPQTYEGLAEFWLTPDQQGEWAIYHWIDNSVSQSPSWSGLKASFGG